MRGLSMNISTEKENQLASYTRWPEHEFDLFAPINQIEVTDLKHQLREAIESNIQPSYVYTYPPRQTYRQLPEVENEDFISQALLQTPNNFNLYLHFPFCKQICSYCNLFVVAGKEDLIDEYIDALAAELSYYAKKLGSQKLRTVYLGGGTPSILNEQQLSRVLSTIEVHFPGFRDSCDEICIEAAPDTIDYRKAQFFRKLGITRVNLGIQTLQDIELSGIGRKHSSDLCLNAISLLKESGLANLCADLINGLLGQTKKSWEESVSKLVKMKPETVCIYPLVVRPATGYHKYRADLISPKEIYDKYDIAWKILQNKGYVQETNVRFVIPGKGAYKQIEYHWEGATILGLGAGARTYAPSIHFRNGYSSKTRNKILSQYFTNIENKGHSRVDGISLDSLEQIRREFVLNLHRLNTVAFESTHGRTFHSCFPSQIQALSEEGILEVNDQKVNFTNKGHKYRDLTSRLFFSERVMELEEEYMYND